MAKRAGNSRGKNTGKDQPERAAGALPPSEGVRAETLAGEAANEIAAHTPAGELEELFEEHIAAPAKESGNAERDEHAGHLEHEVAQLTEIVRGLLDAIEPPEKPYLRVVGRIMYILTMDGGRDSCSATPIAVALLLFLKHHLEKVHQQPGTTRDTIDVLEGNLAGIVYDRLEKLRSTRTGMAQKTPGSSGFRLTEKGCLVFRDWPTDIKFEPHNPDLWRRKKTLTRGRARLLAKPKGR